MLPEYITLRNITSSCHIELATILPFPFPEVANPCASLTTGGAGEEACGRFDRRQSGAPLGAKEIQTAPIIALVGAQNSHLRNLIGEALDV